MVRPAAVNFRNAGLPAAAVLAAVVMARVWHETFFMIWHEINTRDGRATFALLWMLAWLAAAGIASFQKAIPLAGKAAMWILAAPLGFFCLLALGANQLP